MLSAVVVDDPATPGLDLGESITLANGLAVPTSSDLATRLLRFFFIDTDPANWQNTTDPGGGGNYMRVRVQYTFNFLTPLIQQFFPSGRHVITAEALYRNELF